MQKKIVLNNEINHQFEQTFVYLYERICMYISMFEKEF